MCEWFCCDTGVLRVVLIDSVGVSLMAGVAVWSHLWNAIGCGCTPLKVGTIILGVFTAGVEGEIGGGAGICWMGRALGQDVLLTIGQALGTLVSGSSVGARLVSVLGTDSEGARLIHCSNIWRTLLMACSWVSQMVGGAS